MDIATRPIELLGLDLSLLFKPCRRSFDQDGHERRLNINNGRLAHGAKLDIIDGRRSFVFILLVKITGYRSLLTIRQVLILLE